jgi:hypothetical protein
MKTEDHPTPSPKLPDHLSSTAVERAKEANIDRQMKDSFPASDPPSFSGGNHTIGAPKERESDSPTADSHEVIAAEQKVKDGTAKEPHKY